MKNEELIQLKSLQNGFRLIQKNQCPTEIRYRPKLSAETMGIGIGIGAEVFFSETETFFFFFQNFYKFFHVFLLPRQI